MGCADTLPKIPSTYSLPLPRFVSKANMAKRPHLQDCGVWFFFEVLVFRIVESCRGRRRVFCSTRIGIIAPCTSRFDVSGHRQKSRNHHGCCGFFVKIPQALRYKALAASRRRCGASRTVRVRDAPLAVR